MSTRGLSAKQRARRTILDRANRVRLNSGLTYTPYMERHIQRAVFTCRQRGLVKATVLRAAGFNPRGGTE